MTWIVSVVLLVAVFLLFIWFLQKFYVKATLSSALVRTGFGGMRVILDGGCLSLPIIHHTQRVAMGAVSFTVVRTGREALLTGDQLRADVAMEFEFGVTPTNEGVATAAQSLGAKVERGGEVIENVLKGSLIGAMQTAAVGRTLDEMHSGRESFTSEVEKAVAVKAELFGLSLISASLISVDQGDFAQFDENNSFVAQGRRRHAELMSEQNKERVRIETATALAVRESELEKHQRQLEMERVGREAAIVQRESIDRLEADSQAKTEIAKSVAVFETEKARIESEQKAQAVKVASDESLRRSEMAAILALEEAKIANDTQLAHLRKAEFEIKASEEMARVEMLLAAEEVQAQKEEAVAKREHATAALQLQKDMEIGTARAKNEAENTAIKSEAEALATKTLATAVLAKAEAEAAGKKALIGADNAMSDLLVGMRLEERRLDSLPEVMAQMMKPVEKIDSIKINQISGLGGQGGGGGNGETNVEGAFASAMDQILGMAVRLPAMKQMGEDIGLDFDANLAGRTADYANRIKAKKGKTETY